MKVSPVRVDPGVEAMSMQVDNCCPCRWTVSVHVHGQSLYMHMDRDL